MSKQRFIHPELWDDPDLGSLPEAEMLLYIACFSLADDEGRLTAEPAWLRGHIFPYRSYTPEQVREMRDSVAAVCTSFHVYECQGKEFIAFLNWADFQNPKYVKKSKLPAPDPPATTAVRTVLEKNGPDPGQSGENPPRDPATGSNGVVVDVLTGAVSENSTGQDTPDDKPIDVAEVVALSLRKATA